MVRLGGVTVPTDAKDFRARLNPWRTLSLTCNSVGAVRVLPRHIPRDAGRHRPVDKCGIASRWSSGGSGAIRTSSFRKDIGGSLNSKDYLSLHTDNLT